MHVMIRSRASVTKPACSAVGSASSAAGTAKRAVVVGSRAARNGPTDGFEKIQRAARRQVDTAGRPVVRRVADWRSNAETVGADHEPEIYRGSSNNGLREQAKPQSTASLGG